MKCLHRTSNFDHVLRNLRRFVVSSTVAVCVLLGGVITVDAYASAGPRSSADMTYYLNGVAETIYYQWITVSMPCGGWYAGITGGPVADYYSTGYQPNCDGYTPSYYDGNTYSTSYAYDITGYGGDEFQSGSVTYYVS